PWSFIRLQNGWRSPSSELLRTPRAEDRGQGASSEPDLGRHRRRHGDGRRAFPADVCPGFGLAVALLPRGPAHLLGPVQPLPSRGRDGGTHRYLPRTVQLDLAALGHL